VARQTALPPEQAHQRRRWSTVWEGFDDERLLGDRKGLGRAANCRLPQPNMCRAAGSPAPNPTTPASTAQYAGIAHFETGYAGEPADVADTSVTFAGDNQ
jgi:hypothetical protein